MRIAHFMVGRCNPDGSNGIDKSVYYLTSNQAALGHDVALFSVSPKPVIPVPGVDARTYAPILSSHLPRWSLWRQLRLWRPDVVHLHSMYVPANNLVARGLRLCGIPYVVSPHGATHQNVLRRRPYLKRPYRAIVERPTLNRAVFVHALANPADIQSFGVVAPIVVAPNGFDPASIPAGLDRRGCRAKLGIDDRTRLALFLGRLDHVTKGLDLLIEAFAEAISKTGNLALVLVGPDWRGSRRILERLTARYGLNRHVVFYGVAYGKEKFDLLAAADFLVQPSRNEGGPTSVLEALGVGRPCLVTEAADPQRWIVRYGAGAVVKPTVPAIARELKQFAEATDERLAKQGEQAVALIRNEFGWPITARTVVDGYARYALRE